MIVNKQVLLVHPAWCLLFVFAYVLAFYVYYKTTNIFASAIALCAWMILSSYTLYWYYGIPFNGGL